MAFLPIFKNLAKWPKSTILGKKNFFFHYTVAGPKFRYHPVKVRQKLVYVHLSLVFPFTKKVAKKLAKILKNFFRR